jgi:hypothetical protein
MFTSKPTKASFGIAAALMIGSTSAFAGVDDTTPAYPPNGWDHLCAGSGIHVTPSVSKRNYSGSGTCWVNTAFDKGDSNKQNWVSANVSLSGSYSIQSGAYSEALSFDVGGAHTVHTQGTCADDPWATGAQCGATSPSVNLYQAFGWALLPSTGPLSRKVFDPGLVQALLAKQSSKPPLAPVDVDAVRWPASDGKGAVGRVFWRVPDVSDNKWILQFDIETSMNSPNSAFSKVGQIAGPGARSNLSPNEVAKFFWTPSKLQAAEYYYRVCSVNDAGRQCTSPVKARKPTQTELMSVESHHVVMAGGLGGNQPGGPPRVPASTGGMHVALGTAIGNRGGASGTPAPAARTTGVPLGGGIRPLGAPHATTSASGPQLRMAGVAPTALRPGGSPLPDLAFALVTVQGRSYRAAVGANPIIVEDKSAGGCARPYQFPLQLMVKNVGQADFVPKGSAQAVSLVVGPWNGGKNLGRLRKGGSQAMDFNPSLLPGRYTLRARIDLHGGVAEARGDNDGLSLPLEVRCAVAASAPARVGAPPAAVGSSARAVAPAGHMLVPAVRPGIR